MSGEGTEAILRLAGVDPDEADEHQVMGAALLAEACSALVRMGGGA